MDHHRAKKFPIFLAVLLSSIVALSGILAVAIHVQSDSKLAALSSTGNNAVPSNIQFYVPIGLTNTQGVQTVSNLQQMVSVDFAEYSSYLAANASNIEFFDTNWNPLYAWCESGCSNSSSSGIVWLRLNQSIPAYSSITVYMAFYNQTVNNFNSAGYWGEYPTATASYGQFDNAGKVFPLYDNFSGMSLKSIWSVSGGISVAVDNGILISTTEVYAYGGIYTTSFNVTSGQIIDTDELSNLTPTATLGFVSGFTSDNNGGQQPNNGYSAQHSPNDHPSFGTTVVKWSSGMFTPISNSEQSTDSSFVMSFAFVNSTLSESENYVQQESVVDSSYSHSSLNTLFLGTKGAQYSDESGDFQWVRLRNAPPNDVMPRVSFECLMSQNITISCPTTSTTTSTTTNTSSSFSVSYTSPPNFIQNIGELFGNFSQAKYEFAENTGVASSSYNITEGYSVIGSFTNASNDVPLTIVNFTVSGVVAGAPNKTSYLLIYYDPTWTPVVVTQNGVNETGDLALYTSLEVTIYYTLLFEFGNITSSSGLAPQGTTPETFGNVEMNVASYATSVNGTTVIFDIGQVSGTNFQILTYFYLTGSSPQVQNSGNMIIRLLSATQPNQKVASTSFVLSTTIIPTNTSSAMNTSSTTTKPSNQIQVSPYDVIVISVVAAAVAIGGLAFFLTRMRKPNV